MSPIRAHLHAGVVLALLAVPSVAGAQSFTDGGLNRSLTLPDAARVQPSSAPTRVQVPIPVVETEHAPAFRLQRLPARAEGWRIEGEGGELGWPLFVPPGRERGELRFRVAYRTDISVLPASSPLTLLVNGRTIGTAREAASVERVAEFVIPPGAIVPGYNAVTIRAEHRHRVDCSLAATYELWSEINPARTGLVYGEGGEPDAVDPRALPLAPDGALHLRIVSDGRLAPRDVERALHSAQAVAIASGTGFPVVDYGPALAEDAVNIRVDAAKTDEGVRVTRGQPSDLTTDRNTGQSAATLRVGPESDGTLANLPRSRVLGSPMGSTLGAGQASLDGAGGSLPLVGPEPATFGDGRRTVAISVSLPGDFFPADYDRAVLRLTGDWTPGQDTAQARVAIKVNGREVASWPLPAAAGTFTRHPIHLPLGMFRPGVNRVEFETILRSERQGGCEADRRGAARFRLFASSDLTFPRLARIGRFPDLAQMAAAFPDERPLRLIVPRPDRDNMAAAATLLTRMAVAQRREVPFAFSIEGAPAPGEQALIVAGGETTRPELLDIVRLNPARTAETWAIKGHDLSGSRQAAYGGSLWKRAPGCAFGSVANPDGAWTSSALAVETTGSIGGVSAADLMQRPAEVLGRWRDALLGGFGRAPSPAAPSASEVAVLAQGWSEDGARVTLLTGRTGSLRDAATCLSTPAVWNSLSGQASFLSEGADTLRSITGADPAFTATQPASVLNLRLVAAGWLSTHGAAVVAGTLLLLCLVTGSTAALLRRVGRRTA